MSDPDWWAKYSTEDRARFRWAEINRKMIDSLSKSDHFVWNNLSEKERNKMFQAERDRENSVYRIKATIFLSAMPREVAKDLPDFTFKCSDL